VVGLEWYPCCRLKHIVVLQPATRLLEAYAFFSVISTENCMVSKTRKL